MYKMKIKNISILGLTIALISILAISTSYANNIRDTEFTTYYPSISGTKLDSCTNMCHNPQLYDLGDRLGNFYARDYQNANYNFSAIEELDSDGDGVSNIDEINAGTFPGDINDFPITITNTTTTNNTTITTTNQQQNGEILYQNYCSSCHGEFGEGGVSDEDIKGESHSDIIEAIEKVNSMNWLSLLSVNETNQISEYLQTLDENENHDSDENNRTNDNNDNINPNHKVKNLNKIIKSLEKIINQVEKLDLPEDIQQSILESLNNTLTELDDERNLIITNETTFSIEHHTNNHDNENKATFRHNNDNETEYREKDQDED